LSQELFIAKPEVLEIDYTPEEREATFKEIWDNLSQRDVSEYIEQKQGLNYLPWSDCVSILRTEYPDTVFHIYWFPPENESGRWQRLFKEGAGFSVQAGITIKGIHQSLALPIWSGRPPKAIVEPDSMDVNTAIMRCTVKSAAFGFGLGLYIYRGEDLPAEGVARNSGQSHRDVEQLPNAKPEAIATDEQKKQILDLQKQLDFDDEGLAIGIKKALGDSVAVADLTTSQADVVIAKMKAGVKRRSE